MQYIFPCTAILSCTCNYTKINKYTYQEEEREQELLKELEEYDKFADDWESVATDNGTSHSQLFLGHLEKSKSGSISTLNREFTQGSTKDLITDVMKAKVRIFSLNFIAHCQLFLIALPLFD